MTTAVLFYVGNRKSCVSMSTNLQALSNETFLSGEGYPVFIGSENSEAPTNYAFVKMIKHTEKIYFNFHSLSHSFFNTQIVFICGDNEYYSPLKVPRLLQSIVIPTITQHYNQNQAIRNRKKCILKPSIQRNLKINPSIGTGT